MTMARQQFLGRIDCIVRSSRMVRRSPDNHNVVSSCGDEEKRRLTREIQIFWKN
jgi:hypothetical protein